jgi:hypothetical protein
MPTLSSARLHRHRTLPRSLVGSSTKESHVTTPTVAHFHRFHALPLSLLLLVLCFGSAPVATAAPVIVTGPELNTVVLSSGLPGDIMVSGHGFTPGGRVYIALYDQWGMVLHQTRWVTASSRSFQPPQDLAPGESFSFDTGGNIAEPFAMEWAALESAGLPGHITTMDGVDCAAAVMVRAYDRSSATWSAMLDVELGCIA